MRGHWIQIHVGLASNEAIEVQTANISHYSIRKGIKHLSKNGTVQRVYQYCQFKERVPRAQDNRAGHMLRFECDGFFHMTPRDGYINCVLDHPLDHIGQVASASSANSHIEQVMASVHNRQPRAWSYEGTCSPLH